MSLKDRARTFIASRHGGFLASRIALAAEKYLNAYNNVANWDVSRNGELAAVRRVLAVADGDVLDVGANVGQWASAVLPFLGDRTLHCFEPVPAIFAELEKNLEYDRRTRLVKAGLGREDSEVVFNFNPGISTISSAYPLIYTQDQASHVRCKIMVGDDYLSRNGIGQISVLKLDVEGMEAECLHGFERSFAERRIAAVQFEHGPSHVISGHTLKFFLDWFTARAFAVFQILPHRLQPVAYDLERENFSGRNYLAVRHELQARLGLPGT